MKRIQFVLCVLLMLTNRLSAQHLTLDSTFGDKGIVVKTLDGDALPFSVASQTDGKLIVAGYHGWYQSHWSVLSRLNHDGTVDSAYGISGNAETNVPPSEYQQFEDVAIQPDNKAIAVGPMDDTTGEFHLFATRFLENGLPDSSFNNNGIALLGNGFLYTVALQANGKIVMGGTKLYGQRYRFTLLQCNSNGTLDSTFGTNGFADIDFGANTGSHVMDIVIQPDGKIIATGTRDTIYYYSAHPTNNVMARFNAGGSLDSTFGKNGVVLDTRSYPNSFLSLQKNGKILLGNYQGLARYLPNGNIDSTFGSAGKINEECLAVGVDSTDKVVFIGKLFIAPDTKFKVYILDSLGAFLDTVVTDFVGDNLANSICFQPDGKMVVLGRTYRGITGYNPAFILARYGYEVNNETIDTVEGATICAFPNPFSDKLTFALTDENPTTVSVYNLAGDLVFQQTLTESTTVNMEQLASGVYFYELRNSSGVTAKGKVIRR